MCQAVGVAADPDPCVYDNSGRNVISITPNITPHNPEPMPLYQWPSCNKAPLMQDQKFSSMKFNVLNVAHFYQNANGLVKYLNAYKPTFLIIDWCFGTNGDLAFALRARGFFSKLLLEFDMRKFFQE